MHYNGDPAFLKQLLAKLDQVDGLAFLLVDPKDLDGVKDSVKQHSNRLVGFGEIQLDHPKALEQIDRFHAAGFRGLGELSGPKKNYDDPAYAPIYARAEKYGMFVLFHTGIVNRTTPEIPADISVDRMRATTLDNIARRYPKITIIGAHLGNPGLLLGRGDRALESERLLGSFRLDADQEAGRLHVFQVDLLVVGHRQPAFPQGRPERVREGGFRLRRFRRRTGGVRSGAGSLPQDAGRVRCLAGSAGKHFRGHALAHS